MLVLALLHRVGRPAVARFPPAELTWVSSQRTVWTARRLAHVVGIVEERDGTYVAHDAQSGVYNTYRTLSEAMEAFELPEGSRRPGATRR